MAQQARSRAGLTSGKAVRFGRAGVSSKAVADLKEEDSDRKATLNRLPYYPATRMGLLQSGCHALVGCERSRLSFFLRSSSPPRRGFFSRGSSVAPLFVVAFAPQSPPPRRERSAPRQRSRAEQRSKARLTRRCHCCPVDSSRWLVPTLSPPTLAAMQPRPAGSAVAAASSAASALSSVSAAAASAPAASPASHFLTHMLSLSASQIAREAGFSHTRQSNLNIIAEVAAQCQANTTQRRRVGRNGAVHAQSLMPVVSLVVWGCAQTSTASAPLPLPPAISLAAASATRTMCCQA